MHDVNWFMREWGFSRKSATIIVEISKKKPKLFKKFMDSDPVPCEEWKDEISEDDLKMCLSPEELAEPELRCMHCHGIPSEQAHLDEGDECPICCETEAMVPEYSDILDEEFQAMVATEVERDR